MKTVISAERSVSLEAVFEVKKGAEFEVKIIIASSGSGEVVIGERLWP